MIPFDQWLILACIEATAHVRTMQSDPDGENGALRVTLDDGRVYSIHFSPAE